MSVLPMGSHAGPTPPDTEDFPALPAPSNTALMQDTTRLVYRQTSAALMAHFLGMVVLVAVYWSAAPHALLGAWAAAFALIWAGRFVGLLSYDRAALEGRIDSARWLRRWNIGMLLGVGLWSTASMLFYPYGAP